MSDLVPPSDIPPSQPIKGKVERYTSREEKIGLNILLFTFVGATCALVIGATTWVVAKMLGDVL